MDERRGMKGEMSGEIRVEIGGIGFLFRYKNCRIKEDKNSELNIKDFIQPGRSDFIIDVEVGKLPNYSKENMLFEAKENWRSYNYDGNYILETYKSQEVETNRVCVMERSLLKAKLYISPKADTPYNGKAWSLEQLMRIMGQLIVISTLHRYQGLLLHSSGIILNGEGIIFSGISGVGKTTLTKLWQARDGITTLSDDRLIVRREKGRYFIYGTPWPGEGKAVSSMRAPLREIMFLTKAEQNEVVPLNRKESFRQIITQCFPALWDRENIDFSLGFCRDFVRDIPCFEFGFVPDESATDFIEKKLLNG